MKAKKIKFLNISILLVFLILVISIFLFKNKIENFTINSNSENFNKFLNVDTFIKDNNIDDIKKNFYVVEKRKTPEIDFNIFMKETEVLFYNKFYSVIGEGFYWKDYNIYDLKDFTILNKECSINSNEGFYKGENLILSFYPFHRTEDFSQQDVCIFELDKNNFSLIRLSEKLEENETFIKYTEMNTVYDFKVNEKDRAIVFSVFSKTLKDENGNKYLRSLSVSY